MEHVTDMMPRAIAMQEKEHLVQPDEELSSLYMQPQQRVRGVGLTRIGWWRASVDQQALQRCAKH